MRALTLMQPWGWAITSAGKRVENRSWAPSALQVGEVIAIHAGKSYDDSAPGFPAMGAAIRATHDDSEPWRTAGVIVGTAIFRGAHTDGPRSCLNDCMRWGMPDMWHWVLDGTPLDGPVPARGMLGLWTLPADVETAVRAQLATVGGGSR